MTTLIWAWLIRRAMEIGGLVGTVAVFYMSLPPATQEAIQAVLSGGWQNITIGALAPIIVAIWGYVWSFRSTVKPQVVTSEGKQIALPKDSVEATKVEVIAKSAPKPRTLVERLFGIGG